MKIKLFIFTFFFSSFAFATTAEENTVISWFAENFQNITDAFAYTPTLIQQIFAYVIEYAVVIKLQMQIMGLEFAYGIAISMIDNLGINQLLNEALGTLDPDQRQVIGAYGIGVGIMRVIEALTTRFVLNFLGM